MSVSERIIINFAWCLICAIPALFFWCWIENFYATLFVWFTISTFFTKLEHIEYWIKAKGPS